MVTISTRVPGAAAADLGGRGDAVEARHLDVEQGDVGTVLEHRGHDRVAVADLGDHLEVGLEAEQRGQGAADQGLVVGEQQADGHVRTTRSEKPGESSRVDDRGADGRRRARAARPARSRVPSATAPRPRRRAPRRWWR